MPGPTSLLGVRMPGSGSIPGRWACLGEEVALSRGCGYVLGSVSIPTLRR